MDKKVLVEEFVSRGIENFYPSKDFLMQKLLGNEQLTFYLGIDPTGPTLHLGHAIPLLKLSQLQEMGHKIILLIGDFTAMIGDPTDKLSARIPLSREQVLENAKLYKKQASFLLNFEGKNPAEIKYNSSWIDKLSMTDTVKLLSGVTYAQTIKRDMFQKRISEGKDLYLNEFLYPILQGYDSVAMDVDGEIGGNDQTFNMLMGRDLLKRFNNKEKIVISTKLLIDNSGKKMGKTEGNMVTLNDSPEEMFGKVMSWSDNLIILGFELCTKLPMSKIDELKSEMEKGQNPKEVKMILAYEIVSMYHSSKDAEVARKNFEETFSKGEIPDDLPEVVVEKGTEIMDIIVSQKIVSSKSDFKRLVEEGAVSLMSGGEKIKDFHFKIEKDTVIKIGKHKFLNLKIK